MRDELPYKECSTCVTLTDCKHYELSDSPLSLPLPPDNCPKPIKVMKKYKDFRDKRKANGD